MTRDRREAGFTLVELLVAIVVTGIVALLVYGALAAAVDTGRRTEARGRILRAQVGWSALVSSALRNARSEIGIDDAAFVLETGPPVAGVPRDRVTFVTAGGLPPLTPEVDWLVTLGAGPDGVGLAARPIGVEAPVRQIRPPGDLRGIDIRVRGESPGEPWQEDWPAAGTLPAAVELVWWTADGPAGGPLRITLAR